MKNTAETHLILLTFLKRCFYKSTIPNSCDFVLFILIDCISPQKDRRKNIIYMLYGKK